MRAFLILQAASASLFVATLFLVALPRNDAPPKATEKPAGGHLKVSFDEISLGGKARGRVRYDAHLGAEFKVTAWGSEHARVAFDGREYWFWIRTYDPDRHYRCPVDRVQNTDLKPFLRPSFLWWIVNNQTNKEGTQLLEDGEYQVEIDFVKGLALEQRYIRGGKVEARIVVKSFQTSSGITFPALAIIEVQGDSIEMNMGPAETSNPKPPNNAPPHGTEPKDIVF